MIRFATMSAALAALTLTPAAMANDMDDAAPMASGSPVRLVEFDGEWELLKVSTRLRVWRSHLGYTRDVDADGKPTDCVIEDEFRRAHVNQKLCGVLMKHHTFEPARDGSDAPVPGTYSARLSYIEMRQNQDN